MVRIALIENPESGSGEAGRVASLLESAGAVVDTFPVQAPHAAVAAGADRIAVAGGDGSIGQAAELAGAANLPLAVIPTGTANDFAAHFGLPDEIEAACRLTVGGRRTRRVELARVCGRAFVNVAGAGLPPAAAEEAAAVKDRLGALAYPAGALGAGLSAEPVSCAVSADGTAVFSGLAWQVSVAASGAFGGGAGFDTDPADGRLDLIVIEKGSRARLLKHAYGLRLGGIADQEGVLSARAGAVEVRLGPDEKVNIDGELLAASELDRGGTLAFTAERAGFELITG